MKKIFITFLLLLCIACSNPYKKFYVGIDARTQPNYRASSEEPVIYSSDNFQQDIDSFIQKGWWPIGESNFNARTDSVSNKQIIEQAREVGAHIILVSSKFTHSLSGVMPLITPNNTTSYSSGNATAYGNNGMVTAYGNTVTTTYGTQTSYIPYTVNMTAFQAVYLAKFKSKIGIIAEDLDNETKKKFESNSGVRVKIIIEESPAFNANILVGDIILSFGGKTVNSVQHFQDLKSNLVDNRVEIVFYRDDKILKKIIEVNSL